MTIPSILLAEDDNDMRRFLAKALQNAGYDVVSFDNGLSAYERIREEPFNLLVPRSRCPSCGGGDLRRALPGWLLPREGPPPAAGLLFAATLAWFLLGRVLIGFTWRDDALAGPLNGEQAVALAILVGVVIGLAVRGTRSNDAQPRGIVGG